MWLRIESVGGCEGWFLGCEVGILGCGRVGVGFGECGNFWGAFLEVDEEVVEGFVGSGMHFLCFSDALW